jgi:hypothetical protein
MQKRPATQDANSHKYYGQRTGSDMLDPRFSLTLRSKKAEKSRISIRAPRFGF